MKHEEYKLQCKIIENLRSHGWVVFSIPNERNMGICDALRMRASGLTKGAPDLIAWDTRGSPYWFELKTPTGKRSPEQICMEHLAEELVITYKVIRDIKDVEEYYEQLLY